MTLMESSDRNLKLYEEATEKLFAGDFDEALKLYAISMHDEDIYGSMKGYNAVGITFYLKGDIPMAIKCYAVCSRFAALSIPEVLQDYQDMLKDKAEAKDRLLARCSYLAADWGWSESKLQMDEKSQSLNEKNEQLYRDLLMGKGRKTRCRTARSFHTASICWNAGKSAMTSFFMIFKKCWMIRTTRRQK